MVDPRLWYEYRPGQRVMTRERVAGTVTAVEDGSRAGDETYLVRLDGGLGGGEYASSELAPLGEQATASGGTAAEHYPGLAGVLVDRPPMAPSVPASDYHGGRVLAKTAGHWVDTDRSERLDRLAAELLTEANADRWRPDYEGEPAPYAVTDGLLARTAATCPCGTPARYDPDNGWQHSDTSYSHDGAFRGRSVSDLMREAGWVSDLLKPPADPDSSYDWCRFRRDSHCWYPRGLDAQATQRAGYAVWTSVDRGRCPRGSWALQESCPLGKPGDHVPGGMPYATAAGATRPEDIVESEADPAGWEDDVRYRVNCPQHGPGQLWHRDWGDALSSARRHLDSEHHASHATASAPALTRTPDAGTRYITPAEARGNSRPVSREEFDDIAMRGRGMVDQMRHDRAPLTGLDQQWGQVKEHAYGEARKPWGGATIDAHTGVALESDADKYALSVKPPGMQSVSVHEGADRHTFHRAMDSALARFRPLLENGRHHLGVFHDDDQKRIDIDPVVVVDTPDEVEAIGAHTHAIGGAYHFRTGDGYFPPHVKGDDKRGAVSELGQPVRWSGPGHWRSYAESVQPGYTHPDDEGTPA
jgi:hypothetical protein